MEKSLPASEVHTAGAKGMLAQNSPRFNTAPVLGCSQVLKSVGTQKHFTVSTAEEGIRFANLEAKTGDAHKSQLTEASVSEV